MIFDNDIYMMPIFEADNYIYRAVFQLPAIVKIEGDIEFINHGISARRCFYFNLISICLINIELLKIVDKEIMESKTNYKEKIEIFDKLKLIQPIMHCNLEKISISRNKYIDFTNLFLNNNIKCAYIYNIPYNNKTPEENILEYQEIIKKLLYTSKLLLLKRNSELFESSEVVYTISNDYDDCWRDVDEIRCEGCH